MRKRDEIDIGAFAQPAPALDEFRAEIAEMGDRPAKGSEAELQEGEEDLARRSWPRPALVLARGIRVGAHAAPAPVAAKMAA